MVHDTDIVELELKSKRFSLSVKKKEALKAAEPMVQVRVCDLPARCLRVRVHLLDRELGVPIGTR